jgi:hypothetical protein
MHNVDESAIKAAIKDVAMERLLAVVAQKDLLPALGLVSLLGLSQMIGINYSTIRWHLGKGRIPRPTIKLNRRPYYTAAEAEAIAEAWKEQKFSWRRSAKTPQ